MMSRDDDRRRCPFSSRTQTPAIDCRLSVRFPVRTSSASTSVTSAIEVGGGMIGRVGAGDDRRHAARARGIDHRQRRLPHAQQAHLAQVVEVVFVDHGEPRTMAVERVGPLRFRGREHRVEERNTISALAHARGRVQRSQRRIGLLRRPQLRIEPEEVRLPEEHVHRRPRSGAGGVGAGRGGPMCPPHGDTRASDLTIDVDRLPRRARPRKLRRCGSRANRTIASPKPSASIRSTFSTASPPTSASAAARPVTTGAPHAIASMTGSPNPSYIDGYTKISARL
ncbi:MAG: hypothetical protein DMG03_19195 [Acidobacteria bacterium]|nr:MAG: hypothetical protein DMG03_19195 [Acidobacteriota bacterium]